MVTLEIESLKAFEVDWEFKHQTAKRMVEELYPQLTRCIQSEHIAAINLVEIRKRLAAAKEKKEKLEAESASS